MRIRSTLWPAVLLLSAAVGLGAAATPPRPPAGKKPKQEFERLDAWAEKMVHHSKAGKFHLTKNVIVIKGNLRINCDEMIGTLEDVKDAQGNVSKQMTRVVAIGNVKLLTVQVVVPGAAGPARKPWRGSCAKADYDLKNGQVKMLSAPGQPRPRLWRAKGFAEADTIIFFPQRGEYELIGDPVIRGEIPVGPDKP